MGLNLRQAEIDDFDGYCRLYNQVNDVHVAVVPDTFRHVEGAPRSLENFIELLADASQSLVLAELDGQVVGYVHTLLRERPPIPIMVPARYAVVDTLVVDEACRRRGVGRALMTAAEDWAAENGAVYTELSVWTFNRGAIWLYENLGYRVISQRMRKNL